MQNFKNYGKGQVLLTYASLFNEAFDSLLVPIHLGQNFDVTYNYMERSRNILWRSYNDKEELCYEAEFEPWHFRLVHCSVDLHPTLKFTFLLRKLLLGIRKINPHFFREGISCLIETKTDFNLDNDFRSIPILMNNLSKWARVKPRELFSVCSDTSFEKMITSNKVSVPSVVKKKNTYSALDEFPHFSQFYDYMYIGFFVGAENNDSSCHVDSFESLTPSVITEHNSLVEKIVHQESAGELIKTLYSYQKFLEFFHLLPSESFSLSSFKENAVFLPVGCTLNNNLAILMTTLEEHELNYFLKDSSFIKLTKLSNISDNFNSIGVLPNFFLQHGDYGFIQ